ncbi:putative flagellin with Flp1-like domain [Fontibacillus phaseoli]|uniref:Putative flagellin with Flp1-like domain n=1 Tax=Fontibacillus phaseoli TaxID=1416533 RepID=A0A369BFV6_9BACL|nr:Flp1 family type IVb pilin [Fontibacillus phaseoli]RCX20429.1 putative flagellin with Flp1-like domain [Fontibacillus phaseoli]
MVALIHGKVERFWRNEDGLGMLEMILIVAVIVIIAVIFRTQLKEIVTSLLGKAKSKTENFMDGQ